MNGFSPEQQSYIASRASAHGISSEQLLNMLDPEILQNPDLAIAKLQGSEISHILSQSNHPELANQASNMVLEPADGANQARGAADMSTFDLYDVEVRSELQDHQLLSSHNDLDIDASSFDHVQAHGLFQVFATATTAYIASRELSEEITRSTINLAVRIVRELPTLRTTQERLALLDDLRKHIVRCAQDSSVHAAFLMLLLLTQAAWAIPLLAGRGLCTLARMGLDAADRFIQLVFTGQAFTGLRQFFGGAIGAAKSVLNFVHTTLNNIWNFTQQVVRTVSEATSTVLRAVVDIVSTVYRKTREFIDWVWSGLAKLNSWRQLQPA